MTVREFGKLEAPVVLLLKGDEEKDEPLRQMEERYHVVQPVLPAGGGRSCAKEIAAYIAEKFGGRVYALCSTADAWETTEALLADHAVQSEKLVAEAGEILQGSLMASTLYQ